VNHPSAAWPTPPRKPHHARFAPCGRLSHLADQEIPLVSTGGDRLQLSAIHLWSASPDHVTQARLAEIISTSAN